jgi:3-deoxy-D-manno-octulosonic-acid transferase
LIIRRSPTERRIYIRRRKETAIAKKYKKFAEACDLISLGAAESINSYEALNKWFTALKSDETALKKASQSAAAYVETGRGATDRIMKWLA